MIFKGKLVDSLTAAANVINNLKYIVAIKTAFITLMPVIIVGAFAVLISNMIMDPVNGLAYFKPFSFLAAYKPIFSGINYASLNILTILAIFMIGLELGKINGEKNLFPGLLAVICFVSVTPTTIEMMVNGEMQKVTDVLARQFTDTKSLFLGIFVSILSIELYSKLGNSDRLKIKMPESVPSNVAVSFSALIPAIITVTVFSSFGILFHEFTGLYLYDAVYNVVQKPLETVVQGLPGILVLMLVAQIFWVIGIHGNQMVKPIREPLLLGAITVNMTAYEQGLPIPNIITMPFWDVYMSIGGSGITLALLIAIMIASRREDMKEITKLSLVPGLFNINEPVIFGLPIMLNPLMAIPFIVTPLTTGTIGYFSTLLGFAGKAVIMVPWTTPPIINAYLSTGGSIGAVATQIICIVVAIMIYLPFVKIANKRTTG